MQGAKVNILVLGKRDRHTEREINNNTGGGEHKLHRDGTAEVSYPNQLQKALGFHPVQVYLGVRPIKPNESYF